MFVCYVRAPFPRLLLLFAPPRSISLEGRDGVPHPKNSLASDRAKVLRKFCENSIAHAHHNPEGVSLSDATRFSRKGASMEKKWRVSDVELLEGGLLFGFALYDQKGMPCVSFGYQTEANANAARNHVMAALNGAEEVLCG